MISSRRQVTRDSRNYTAWPRVAVAIDGILERRSRLLMPRSHELAAIEGLLAVRRLFLIQDPVTTAAQTPLEYFLFFAIGVQA